ncbi:MAG: hypothetical protein AB7V13_21460 [Pseudorhodoplanes sp.]|uniref:hypothetical protein n=1 Tax=Pseudorhodoplanes sp. TaxID=1934341 RepID=UPI003D106DFD
MAVAWTTWKTFPAQHSDLPIDAPDGPGVFEVRHMATGEQIAFGVSANVADSLEILIQPPASGLRSIFARKRIAHRPVDLEFRVCATASLKEARAEEERLDGLRRAYMQRRKASGWA